MSNEQKDNKEDLSLKSPSEGEAISEDVEKLDALKVLHEKADDKEGVKTSKKKEFSQLVKDMPSLIRDYVNTYISLADTKAGFLLGITIGMLTAIYFYGPKVFETNFKDWGILGWMTLFGYVFLTIGIYCTLLVVWPRTPTSSKKGLFSWVHIANYNGTKEYFNDLFRMDDTRAIKGLYELNYDLAKVCKNKYMWLARAFKMILAGIVIGTVVLAIHK